MEVCCLVTLIPCSPTLTADELEDLSVIAANGEYSLGIAVVRAGPHSLDRNWKRISVFLHDRRNLMERRDEEKAA